MAQAVLITGAAKRVGKEIALRLAEGGYDIALHYYQSEMEAEQTAGEIRGLGVACELLPADVSDAGQCAALVDKALEKFPKLTALVNSASVFDSGAFIDSDYALFSRQFRINFEAPVLLTQAFAKAAKKGAVVNMLDTMVTQNRHTHFYYLLSKKALLEFTRMAAVELAPDIRVNGVCPGYVLPSAEWGDDYRTRLEAQLPMKKTASVADVASAVQFMITAQYVTGQCLFVDGGEQLL